MEAPVSSNLQVTHRDKSVFIESTEFEQLFGALQNDPEINCSTGSHRTTSTQYIHADTDLEAIHTFLNEYSDRPNTYRTYTKESLRYLLWSSLIAHKPISSLNADDVYAFERFLRQPPKTWCRPRVAQSHPDYQPFMLRLKDGSFNPHWRPFQGPLAESSVKVALNSVKSLHSYLFDANYTDRSPFNLRRNGRREPPCSTTKIKHKALTDHQWALLNNAIAHMPEDTDKERVNKQRALFIVSTFYYLGLRISEAVAARMSDFTRDRQANWWLNVVGKGAKSRNIPVPDAYLLELRDYRLIVLNQDSPTPEFGEETPLICSVVSHKPLTANRVYRIVKELFQMTADSIDDSDPDDAANKHFFSHSTAHWLRHTYGTNIIERGGNPRTAQLNMGHESINTTMVYSHRDDLVRHTETNELLKE